MMNGGYLVPANAKKGDLIFNLFRKIDLILLCVGVGLSVALLALFNPYNLWVTVMFCLPACVCGFLVLPIPNYHNVLCALQSFINFEIGIRSYKWKGWCFYEQFRSDEKSKK